LLALRLRPAAGTALVTLMRMLMRMFAWLLPRRRCVAALREGGYRHRQDEVRKTRAKESTPAILVDFLMLPLHNGRPSAVPPC
jgi:hypothetical protein